MIPEQCDYLVVGGGATGMAFVDTLLKHSSSETSVVLIDKHGEGPGGQWQDSYNFVRLHQPSSMYGVESEKLEPNEDGISSTHRATREEIIEYYDRVVKKLEAGHDFHYLGGMEFDFSQLSNSNDNDGDSINGKVYVLCDNQAKKSKIRVSKRLVDARYLQPDLPVFIPPKFSFDPSAIQCASVNEMGILTTDPLNFLPGENQLLLSVLDCTGDTQNIELTLTTQGCEPPLRLTTPLSNSGIFPSNDEDEQREGWQVSVNIAGEANEEVSVSVSDADQLDLTFGPVQLDELGQGSLTLDFP